jgi:hypothetical protein
VDCFPPEAGDAEGWRDPPAAERRSRLTVAARKRSFGRANTVSEFLDLLELWIFDEANFCSARCSAE